MTLRIAAVRIAALLAAAFMLHACAGPGPATQVAVQSPNPGADRAFMHAASTWDADGNGVVTCDEWKAYATRMFTTGDTNHDGALDAGEYQALGSRDRLFATAGLAYFDANKDNKLTKQEFVETPNPAFAYLDGDKDCNLTFTELAGGQPKEKKAFNRDELFPSER